MISTLRAARLAGCQTTNEISAFAAAKWEMQVSDARDQLPPFEAYLHRVNRNEVLLTVQCHDRCQILGWDKVVLVRDCGEVMKNNTVMHAACNSVLPQFFETVQDGVVFELITHDNSVSISHAETEMDVDERTVCEHYARNAVENLADEIDPPDGTDGAHALMLAIDAARGYGRTHVVVMVADKYRNADWDAIRSAKEHLNGHVYVTAVTIGDRAQEMLPFADNVVHWGPGDSSDDAPRVPDASDFVFAMKHANSHVSTGLRMSLRTQCTDKPYFSCQTLPSVRRSTPNAMTIIGGRVCELLASERTGVRAFMQRDLETAEERGVQWRGTRMLVRNDNLRQFVPIVDTTRVRWNVCTRNVPLVWNVPFRALLRLSPGNQAGVTVQLENGRNAQAVSLKSVRARTTTSQRIQDAVSRARWRGYVQYVHDCADDFEARDMDEVISRAPSSTERRVWTEQRALLQSGQTARAARKREHAHMQTVHQTENTN